MIADIFHAHSLLLLAPVVAGGFVSYVVAAVFLKALHRGYRGDAASVPVAPFFASVTTIWALMFGFLASEVWSTVERAHEAALVERTTLQRLVGMAHPDALDLEPIRGGLHAYVDAVSDDEWGRHANVTPTLRVDASVREIRLGLLSAERAGVSPIMMAKMIADFDQLQDARAIRLAIGAGDFQGVKWALVILLALFSQLSIAVVHRDRPRAGRFALALFTIAACTSLWLVALHATPYSGAIRVSEEEITGLF